MSASTSFVEETVQISCGASQLFGILARPVGEPSMGVVIAVGGPQYRVGSHRQFTLLSRALASNGIAALRFDYRGMGDSSGDTRDFEHVSEDIATAIDALRAACPGLKGIALWGLCDAASAVLLYWEDRRDTRVSAICLLNPWVRSEATLARAHVKHYYRQRLLERDFWLKMLRGDLNVVRAIRGFLRTVRVWFGGAGVETGIVRQPFQVRMALALKEFPGPVLLILSGDDYTAKEFIDCACSDMAWTGVLQRKNIRRIDIADADHTFSSLRFRSAVEQATVDWMQSSVVEALMLRDHSEGA